MRIIEGRYNKAVVFANHIEDKAADQIKTLCDQEFTTGSRIRIMPDNHAGAGCTIGTTMTIKDKLVPNLVGVDIGCGIYVVCIKKTKIDFAKLDKVIRNYIPSGFNIRKTPHPFNDSVKLDSLCCKKYVNLERAGLSIGTLGGGNHFIEMNVDADGGLYLAIHSGSRNLGKQIAGYYQERASRDLAADPCENAFDGLKAKARNQGAPGGNKAGRAVINKELAYLKGAAFDEYIHDMEIAQEYAKYNREAIAEIIVQAMGFRAEGSFATIHNYIDLQERILRKGAISAKKGELVIIPVNMRDGSILASGKGNEEWNQSAPHGAGRLMSRSQAKRELSLAEFQKSMSGVYTTTVSQATLDEAPAAYKPMAEIIAAMQPAVDIQKIIRPIYNFKAAEDK